MSFGTRNSEPPAAPPAADAGVRSVEAALRVLELVACSLGPARVTAIAQTLALGKPRVSRHLATLEAMGLVRRAGRQGYVPGERLSRLAHHVLRERTIGDIAHPALEALRDDLRQTITLSAPAPEGAIVLHCYESPQPMSIHVRAGTLLRYPHSPAARLAIALAGDAEGASAPPSTAAAAREALSRWRAQGIDYEIDTQGTGLGGVAAPVFAGRTLVGLVSVVLSSRLLMPAPPARLVQALRRSVSLIEDRLGA